MQLVIVESPAKAKTIEKYLGKDYKVLASYGHIRDLPPKDGSVRPDEGFEMDWELYGDKQSRVREITDAAKQADRLILATDPDREGEAISWHVRELLKKRRALPKEVERVTFNAITKDAVTTAMKHPRELDQDLIDAYLARRALDYLFGFTLSPVLWRKLPGAKSAGRVQSVALRLIVEREREIESFKPQEYWQVIARLLHDGTHFPARLVKFEGQKLDKLSLGEEGIAKRAKAAVEGGAFRVEEVETKPARRNPIRPSPPRPCSRRPRASWASRPCTRCAWRRRCMRRARSPICVPMACRWTPAPSTPRARKSPSVSRAISAPKSRAITRPRPRMLRKRMRRSAPPTSRATPMAAAMRRACMI
jgi:DNA topoisomerase-1